MLREKLKEYAANAKANMPDEVIATMEKALGELQATHIEEKTIKVGDKLPDFNLIDTKGNKYNKDSFKNKKLVLNFFRGSW